MAARIKLLVVAVFCMGLFAHAQSTQSDMSACNKKEDAICVKRDQSWCHIPNVQRQCPRLCGICAPFTSVCPSNYPFGCCWDGTESLTFDKSDCNECKDRSPQICQRHRQNCDLKLNTPQMRKLCPVTCDACGDYGN